MPISTRRAPCAPYCIPSHLVSSSPQGHSYGHDQRAMPAAHRGESQEKGWNILTLAIEPDHIHLFVRVWPSDSAAEVVKDLKGVTSFFLRKEFASILKKLPSTWTRSYFASTAGALSAETIQCYIAAQKGV